MLARGTSKWPAKHRACFPALPAHPARTCTARARRMPQASAPSRSPAQPCPCSLRVCSVVPFSHREAPSSPDPLGFSGCLSCITSARGNIVVFSFGVLVCEPHSFAPLLFCLGTAQGKIPPVQLLCASKSTLLTSPCTGEGGEIICLWFRVILSSTSSKLAAAAHTAPLIMGMLVPGLCRSSLCFPQVL